MNSLDAPPPWIGTSPLRKEDARLLSGRGQFLGDLRVEGLLHLVYVRSSHAHARIVAIDVTAAEATPGVVAVLTGERIRNELKSLPIEVVTPNFNANYPVFWPLAVERVKFHGEPVAAIVAEDKYVAEDAAELVEVTYDSLEPVLDMERALEPGSPIVHPGWASKPDVRDVADRGGHGAIARRQHRGRRRQHRHRAERRARALPHPSLWGHADGAARRPRSL